MLLWRRLHKNCKLIFFLQKFPWHLTFAHGLSGAPCCRGIRTRRWLSPVSRKFFVLQFPLARDLLNQNKHCAIVLDRNQLLEQTIFFFFQTFPSTWGICAAIRFYWANFSHNRDSVMIRPETSDLSFKKHESPSPTTYTSIILPARPRCWCYLRYFRTNLIRKNIKKSFYMINFHVSL